MILDGGTTTLAMVDVLPRTLRCTVITHSPTIAAALLDHAADVFLIGGQLFKHSGVACGAAAVEAANRVSADLFFVGVTGVHSTAGLTTGDPDEAAMKRTLAARAAETYVLASEEKIGAASRYDVLPFDAVTGVISDTARERPCHACTRRGGSPDHPRRPTRRVAQRFEPSTRASHRPGARGTQASPSGLRPAAIVRTTRPLLMSTSTISSAM